MKKVIGIIVLMSLCLALLYGCTSEKVYKCSFDSDCKKGGCSQTVCEGKDEPATFTTCEWKEEYECYQQAQCGCVSEKCQWKDSETLDECISEKRASE